MSRAATVTFHFTSFMQRVRAAWAILWHGAVEVSEVQITERSAPTVKELCTVLAAVMCAPETTERDRLECANTLSRFAFPETPRPSSGYLRTKGN